MQSSCYPSSFGGPVGMEFIHKKCRSEAIFLKLSRSVSMLILTLMVPTREEHQQVAFLAAVSTATSTYLDLYSCLVSVTRSMSCKGTWSLECTVLTMSVFCAERCHPNLQRARNRHCAVLPTRTVRPRRDAIVNNVPRRILSHILDLAECSIDVYCCL